MTETRDIRSIVEAAEQAAATGDYGAAEQLLTQVAELQESTLGPLHPDLANTLNNLGVVCEILEKPLRAERHFRRAWEIASAALEPDHPFVATSRKNLEDFCNSRGIALDAPPLAPPALVETDVRSSSPAGPSKNHLPTPFPVLADRPTQRKSHDEPRAVTPSAWSRPIAIAALAAGVLVVALIATATWRGTPVPADAPAEIATDRREPVPSTPEAVGPTPAAPPAVRVAQTPALSPPAATSRPIGTAPAKPPVVAAAQLCETLSTGGDWTCVPAGPHVSPGALFFYSRLKSPADTTVEHRWYHGSRLRRSVKLSIGANTTGGYRTYSRQTVDGRGGTDWRVELRSMDGTLLQEERFSVR